MNHIKAPNGMNLFVPGGPDKATAVEKLRHARHAFILAYTKTKGWSGDLSMEQILEIRRQEGWKNPKVD